MFKCICKSELKKVYKFMERLDGDGFFPFLVIDDNRIFIQFEFDIEKCNRKSIFLSCVNEIVKDYSTEELDIMFDSYVCEFSEDEKMARFKIGVKL